MVENHKLLRAIQRDSGLPNYVKAALLCQPKLYRNSNGKLVAAIPKNWRAFVRRVLREMGRNTK